MSTDAIACIKNWSATRCPGRLSGAGRGGSMPHIGELLRQEHSNMESLLCILERELNVFGCGDRPDYEVILAVIDYFRDYPDACHHPKENLIVEKLKARDPVASASIGDLEAEHREEASRLRRVP